MLKVLLIIGIGGAGMALSLKHLWKNVLEIKAKPKGSHSGWDWALNYPLTVLWFTYLTVFFGGLIVNNLIIH